MSIKDSSKRWFSVFRPEKFHLMLYYSITSFVVISSVSYVVGQVISRTENNELIKRSEKYAGYMVANINYVLYEEFFRPTIEKYGYIDLENSQEQFDKLDEIIKSNIYGLNLRGIYLFDLNGQIIYSDVPEHIGFILDRGEYKQLDLALKGIAASALKPPDMKDSKGVVIEEDFLESYYPIYEYKGKIVNKEKQVGVLEIYQDMEDLHIQLARTHRRAVIMTGSGMGVLFLILLLIVKQASNIIHLKTNQIVEARDNLEEKVEDRAKQIKETYQELQEAQKRLSRSEKLAGIGTLAAGVAHEINNPLASVAGCAEGLIKRLDNLDFKTNDDKEVFPDYLDTIYHETYRCKLIISKLLDFSRQKPPVFGKIDINTLVSDVVKTVGRQTDSKKVEVLLALSSRSPTIWGDVNQLKQVFTNFISNASDAIQHEGSIWVSTTSSDDSVQITFKDTGYGIAPENLNKVFEPFFTTKEPGKGTGLGLAICYGIIEEHEGKISVDSKGIGQGTTFTISLPIYNESSSGKRI